MGVKGFARYIAKRFPNLGQELNLNDIDCNRLIIIDGNSLLYFLAQKLDFLLVNYTLLQQRIIEFLNLFRNYRIQVVFDGSLPKYKLNERITRMNQNIQDSIDIMNQINGGKQYNRIKLLPPFAFQIIIETCILKGVDTIIAMEEADPLIIKLALINNAIVISQDSDFLISKIPAYCPLEYFIVTGNCLKIKLFTPEMISKSIMLPVEKFELLQLVLESDHWNRADYKQLLKEFNIKSHQIKEIIRKVSKVDSIEQLMQGLSLELQNTVKLIYESNLFKVEKSDEVEVDVNGFKLVGHSDHQESMNAIVNYFKNSSFNFKIIELVLKQEFWCRPLIGSTSAWNTSFAIRNLVYNEFELPVTEHHPTYKHGMQTKLINSKISANPLQLELCAEKEMDIKSIFVISVRYLLQNSKKRFCNYDIVGLSAYFTKILHGDSIDQRHQPGSYNISLLSTLETILYSYSILLPLKLQQTESNQFWKLINGPLFHFVMMQAKRGSPPKSLIANLNSNADRFETFKSVHHEIVDGLLDLIEVVFEYEG